MIQTTIRYRLAQPQDFAQLMALRILAYQEFLPGLTEDNQQILNAALNNEAQLHALLEQATCFVADDTGYIAGMAYLIPSGNPTEIYPADWRI